MERKRRQQLPRVVWWPLWQQRRWDVQGVLEHPERSPVERHGQLHAAGQAAIEAGAEQSLDDRHRRERDERDRRREADDVARPHQRLRYDLGG